MKRHRPGKIIRTGEQQIIINLYLQKKKEDSTLTEIDCLTIVSEQTGISISSVRKFIQNHKNGIPSTSPENKKPRMTIVQKLDEFDREAIRRKVHSFYLNSTLPTIDKILEAVNDDEDLPNFKRSTFQKVMKDLNFKYEVRGRNSFLIEREDIVVWRRKYLRAIHKYRQEGRSIFYLDETWFNAGDTTKKAWIDQTITSAKQAKQNGLSPGPSNPTSKGKRYIVGHIGSENGFVDGALWCFESKKNSSDYHHEMNGDSFMDWLKKIISLLPKNSVIVLDNAPYHSVKAEKTPTTAWRKQDIRDWLESKNISAADDLVKAELLHIVSLHKHKYNKYVIDVYAEQNQIAVLRLPPYHCELNPIELGWAMVKNYVKHNNTTFKMKDVEDLLKKGIERVTPDNWKNFIKKTIDLEKKFWDIDAIVDTLTDTVDSMIINVNDNSSSSSDEE